ncbi:alpha/beta hydrolase [Neobacillus sp. D3-1R]|uniref:alpha/beta hydrolase n=1 Tax=Neobacillus sp. D3-1R TaxID=3445778 RepID=UPI003FA09EA6
MIEFLTLPLFHEDRKIRVYLPVDYDSTSKTYPVLYMHDGQNVLTDDEAIGGVSLGLQEYLDEEKVDLIVVAIDQNTTGDERFHEYCPWVNGEFCKEVLGYESKLGGKGEEYTSFIVHELKPFIDRKYRTQSDQSYMAGISLGGLISTYAACRYPHLFKRVAILSSAFYRNQEEIENLLKKSDLSNLEKFYMDCGTEEAGENTTLSKQFYQSNQAIYEILKDKIEDIQFETIEGAGHSYSFFKKRFPEFLQFLCS